TGARRSGSVAEGGEAAPAVRAVVHVPGRELLERAAAEPQVLDRPRQVAVRRRQRQHLAHHVELLAGLAVDVDGPRLDLADQLAVRTGPQAVPLALAHRRGNISSPACGS